MFFVVARLPTTTNTPRTPFLAARGLSPTADISSPAEHICINFSQFGRYGALTEYRGIKSNLCFHHTSRFRHMWQLVLVCRALALTTAQCHKNVLLSYYHAYFSIEIDSFIHSFRIEGNEAHQIRCILRMRLRMDRASRPPTQVTRIMLRATINILCINLCSVLVEASNVQLKSRCFLFSYRTKQMLNMYVRNS